MKHYLYHVTPKENVASILDKGLIRGGGKRKAFAISCSEKPTSWYTPNMALLKVRTTGLKCEITTFLPESDEILIWGDIPPERIRLCKAYDVIPKKVLRKLREEYKDNETNNL